MIEHIYQTRCGPIHYWISDNMDNSKPTLVFLPGLTADHHLFDQQIPYFSTVANVFVWDAPAHAASWPFTFDFTLKDKAIWLKEILDIEQIASPIIIGQSMGGYVGQMLAELYPDLMKGFVSIDSAPLQRQYVSGMEIWLLKHVEWVYRIYPWSSLLKAGSKGVAVTDYGRRLMREMMMGYDHKRYARICGHGYGMLADAMEADLPYVIHCPALLICGMQDQAGSTRRYNKAWHEKTGFRLEWINGAGHNANADQPEQVNRLIEQFLGQLQQTGKD